MPHKSLSVDWLARLKGWWIHVCPCKKFFTPWLRGETPSNLLFRVGELVGLTLLSRDGHWGISTCGSKGVLDWDTRQCLISNELPLKMPWSVLWCWWLILARQKRVSPRSYVLLSEDLKTWSSGLGWCQGLLGRHGQAKSTPVLKFKLPLISANTLQNIFLSSSLWLINYSYSLCLLGAKSCRHIHIWLSFFGSIDLFMFLTVFLLGIRLSCVVFLIRCSFVTTFLFLFNVDFFLFFFSHNRCGIFILVVLGTFRFFRLLYFFLSLSSLSCSSGSCLRLLVWCSARCGVTVLWLLSRRWAGWGRALVWIVFDLVVFCKALRRYLKSKPFSDLINKRLFDVSDGLFRIAKILPDLWVGTIGDDCLYGGANIDNCGMVGVMLAANLEERYLLGAVRDTLVLPLTSVGPFWVCRAPIVRHFHCNLVGFFVDTFVEVEIELTADILSVCDSGARLR